jgi:putative endonuclease
LVAKPQRLLIVEVKARRKSGPDGAGIGAFNRQKRLRIERCFICWLAEHPDWQEASVEICLALVTLSANGEQYRTKPIRWLLLHS